MIKRLLLLSGIVLYLNSAESAYGYHFVEPLEKSFIDARVTVWDGSSWDNGTPDQDSEIVINGPLVLSQSLHVSKLTIAQGGSVTVPSGISLTVTNEVINLTSSQNFIVENGGNLIQTSSATNVGEITVKRNSLPMVRNDMTFWSSPVSEQNIRQFSPETLHNRFWNYEEATDLFQEILTSNTDSRTFANGQGYSIRAKNTLSPNQSAIHQGEFKGIPFNGDLQVEVTRLNNGFNLVGNPYASDIDIAKFFKSNTSVKAIYIWTHEFPTTHVDYNNNYEVITRGGSEHLNYDRIKVGDGFLVWVDETNNGEVVFNNLMRNVEITTKDSFWVQLSSETEVKNQINVSFIANADDGYDSVYDKRVTEHLNTGVYSVVDVEKLVISANSLPFELNKIVKLGFKALEAGTYTLGLPRKDGLFRNGQTIYLKDYLTQTAHNLSSSNYSFTSQAGEFNERFEIVFEEPLFLNVTDIKDLDAVLVYRSKDGHVINSSKELIKSVEIFDVSGRKIDSRDQINQNQYQLKNYEKGIYILKILDSKGKVTIKKISI